MHVLVRQASITVELISKFAILLTAAMVVVALIMGVIVEVA
jgi:hypothetical protein